jgi:hypothetical protein
LAVPKVTIVHLTLALVCDVYSFAGGSGASRVGSR